MVRVYISGDSAVCRNYSRAILRSGGVPCFNADPQTCHALLLPGGGDVASWRYGQTDTACRSVDPERDGRELALLERFTAWGRPVLGVCRGMQVINVFFGGTLTQDLLGHSQIDGRDRLHTVTSAPSPLRELYGERCLVNSAHHQAVSRLGSGLEALQWAEDGVIEALRHQTLPILAVQWHPERLSPPGADGLLLYRAFLSAALLQKP